MVIRDNLIFILSGILLGIIIAIPLMYVVPPLPDSNVPETAANLSPHQERSPVIIGELPRFSSQEEAMSFIRARTDKNSAGPSVLVPDAGSLNSHPQTWQNGTRTWSFDIDTSTFKPDEYLVKANSIHYDVTATGLFNVVEHTSRGTGPQPVQTTVSSSGTGNYFIAIDTVGDRLIGERFSITGTTNLPADEQMLIEVYSSSFKPTQKSQSGEFSGATGTIRSSASSPLPAPTAAAAPATGRTYSTTNVQVRGVDEADIIKTDGTYIYVVTGNTLRIVRAYPPDGAGVISTQKFTGVPQALYVSDDRLVLICDVNKPVDYWDCPAGRCNQNPRTVEKTQAFIYSVKDPAHPELVRVLEIDGRYKDSRLIGTKLYFVTNGWIDTRSVTLEFPKIDDSKSGTSVLPVYYFDQKDREFYLTSIGTADIRSDEPVNARAFLVGSAGTVYVSATHLYIAVPDSNNYRAPASTAIYSFEIDDGRITYAAKGVVDGTLLNQYSMDEYDGNLRVATTVVDQKARWSSTYSMVTVLDNRMNVIGTVDDIAPNERIYAARFLGDRLYMVTFRETDPFFVIDLSQPEHPKILGELHIPGFSSYLHPYDATHIIGIGKQSAGGGLKIALFDVADVCEPRLTGEVTLGAGGSDSEVLRDAKAFLFDREKNILVLPVHIVETARSPSPVNSQTFNQVMPRPAEWGGAYVFGVSPSKGFSLKGTVIHYQGTGGSYPEVRRSLYIEDTLYTMSTDKIVMSDIMNGARLIGEVIIK